MRKIITLLTLALTLLCCCSQAVAQSSHVDTQKRVIEGIKRQIAEGEKLLISIRSDKSSIQRRVNSLSSQINQRTRLLEAQRTQIALIEEEIAANTVREEELGVELSKEREAYGAMVREAYRNYRNNNFVSYIFASKDFNDVARRIVNIRRVAHMREQRILSIDSLSLSLDSTRCMLLERKASLDSVMQDIVTQKSSLQRDVNSARADVNAMSSREKSALRENALQQERLDTAIEELRRLTKGNSTGDSFKSTTSNLNLPVEGGRVKRYMDNMAEIVGAEGAAVIAIYEGKVVEIKQNRITGRYEVYVAHGEYISSYAGLRTVSVKKDSTVKKNQTIGEVGAAVDILTMNSEYKIIFGIYPPSPTQKMKAADCFKR